MNTPTLHTLPHFPDAKTEPFAYLTMISQDKRAERDQQTANEILTAIGAIRDERDRLREVNQELLSALEITEARLDALMRSREMDSTTRPFHAVRTIRDDARAAIAKATT